MKTKLMILLAILVGTHCNVSLQAQEPQLDTVWMRWTHDISRLEFSNDDSKILTVGSGGIIIFDTQSGTQIKQLPGYLDAEYSSDNSLIFAVRETPDSVNNVFPFVDVINSVSFEILKTIKLPKLPFNPAYSRLAVSEDMRTIAVTASNINGLYLIDNQTDTIIKFINKFGNETRTAIVGDFVFSKDGQDIIVSLSIDIGQGNYHGELMFINVHTLQMDYRSDIVGGILRLSDDGILLASMTSEFGKAVAIMNTQTHEIINTIPGVASSVASIAFSPDGQYLALSGNILPNYSNKITIYSLADIKVVRTISFWESAFAGGVKITKNNKYIAAGGGPGLVLFNFITTGIHEPKDNIETLYPNPTNNSLTVNFNLSFPTQLDFNLYDISGLLISNLKSQFYEPGSINENLFLGDLSSGSYFLKIESANFSETFKIIVNK